MSKLKIVVFTGAGISKESGLHTFRDSDGLWANHKIEDVCTPQALKNNLQGVLDFYNQRRKDVLAAEPNLAHKVIAELEENYDVTVITQNIDDLHERGGSTNVLHLHGEITKCRGIKGTKLYDYNSDLNVGDICGDGHQMRPHIVFFGEPVPMMNKAIKPIVEADILVIIGTSLQVSPAADLVNYVRVGTPIFAIGPEVPLASDLSPYAFGGSKDAKANYTPIQKVATEGVPLLVGILDRMGFREHIKEQEGQ